ncbi:uncharacterized protein BXZ73DRAFT_97593 [Epithele typhae]|uniref:uncharacterized protein n=1 Tax=Epithele typhae TaxID=378194 RepID=UPI0020082111|nr:uncharacterized protein BXZ73DRAFT_97593 [Epithele typhae]KAH9942173.1 hypothetical protein BXZ73DRAFT_97593 [Epithele typhae]
MAREAEEGAKEKRKAAEELAWKKRNAAEEAEWKKRKAAGEAERRKRKAADDAEKRRQEAEDAMDIEEENEVCAMLDDLSLEHDENENEDEDEDVETEDAGKMTAAVDAPLAPASTRKPSRTPIHLQLPFEQRQAHVPRVVFALRQPEEQARTATELAAAAALVGLWSEGRLQPSVRRRVAPLPKRKVVSVASRSGQAGVARA